LRDVQQARDNLFFIIKKEKGRREGASHVVVMIMETETEEVFIRPAHENSCLSHQTDRRFDAIQCCGQHEDESQRCVVAPQISARGTCEERGARLRETGRKDKTIAQGKAQLAYTEMAMDRLVLI